MEFILNIKLENEAMLTGHDIAGALRRLSDDIDDSGQYFNDPDDESGFDRSGRIKDINGNTVGYWRVVE